MSQISSKCIHGHSITLTRSDSGEIAGEIGTSLIDKLPDPEHGRIEVSCKACETKVHEMLAESRWLNI